MANAHSLVNFVALQMQQRLLLLLLQVLLFPGGAREVNKKVGEEYKLFWKDSPGGNDAN
jgi:hypothetical protein